MKVLFVSNIPVPYRVQFYNELGKCVDLTVIFEAKGASDQGIRFNYNLDDITNFKAIFLTEGNIKEDKVNWSIFKYFDNTYDNIVLTSYSYLTEMAFLLYLKVRRIPYYLSSDGGMVKFDESILKKGLKTFLISGAKGYFSPSKMTDQYLMYYGANSHTIYRYPFTSYKKELQLKRPISSVQKEKRKKQLGFTEKYLVLGVGQFIHRKGWDILLRAFASINEDVALCLIGGGVTDEYIQLINEYKLKHVYFKEFMGDEQLREYYMAADVFVLPTREDIWGLVINEAMACGLPIVTTDRCIAGLEMVKNGVNGFIVKAENADMLHDAIEKIISNESLQAQMAAKSLEVAQKYTIEQMVQSHIHAFEDFVDRGEI